MTRINNEYVFNPNDVFGYLTVIKKINKDHSNKRTVLLCKCICGKEIKVLGNRLASKIKPKKSCGCMQYKNRTRKQNKGYMDISGEKWYQYKLDAERRGYSFNISIEKAYEKFIEQNGKCALSGVNLLLSKHSKDRGKITASIDRIDNSLGYELNNIWWVHKDINWMKNRYSLEYFIEMCKKVAKKYG